MKHCLKMTTVHSPSSMVIKSYWYILSRTQVNLGSANIVRAEDLMRLYFQDACSNQVFSEFYEPDVRIFYQNANNLSQTIMYISNNW